MDSRPHQPGEKVFDGFETELFLSSGSSHGAGNGGGREEFMPNRSLQQNVVSENKTIESEKEFYNNKIYNNKVYI